MVIGSSEIGPTVGGSSSRSVVWARLSLTRRFVVAALPVLLLGTMLVGFWVADRVKRGIAQSSAASVALYLDSVIAPLAQGLDRSDAIVPEHAADLDRQLAPLIGKSITSLKIWRLDNSVAYSTRKGIVGQKFTPTAKFLQAARGQIAAEFEGAPHEGDRPRDEFELEIYAPVFALGTDRVIAVAEVYAIRHALGAELRRALLATWLTIGSIGAGMLAALTAIVRGGSRTIETQERRLHTQVHELETLLDQNRELRERVQRARQRSAQLNESMLRGIGSDLHDGPAQLIGLSLLLLDSDQTERVRAALRQALKDIRTISGGLVMPEIAHSPLDQVVAQAVRFHEIHTGTKVAVQSRDEGTEVPIPLKVCAFRVVQEGLSNAFHHARGRGQRVELSSAKHLIRISISDEGPDVSEALASARGTSLGLVGLRDRVETLGGDFQSGSNGLGYTICAEFDLRKVKRIVDADL